MASLLSSSLSLNPPNLPKFSKTGFNHGTNPKLSILHKRIRLSTKIQTQIQSHPKILCSHDPNPSVLSVLAQKAAILIVGSLLLVGRFNAKPALALADASKTSFSEKVEEKRDAQEEKEDDGEMYAKILERNPNDVEALKVVLYGKMRKGKMKEAVKFVGRLIRLEPEEVEWRLLEALCYELMGDLRKAKKLFKEILKERPLLIRALHTTQTKLEPGGRAYLNLSRSESSNSPPLTAKISNYNLPMLSMRKNSEVKLGVIDLIDGSTDRGSTRSFEQGEKGDVYQLGLVILEIITGKPARSQHELEVVKIVMQDCMADGPTRLKEVADPTIRGTFASNSLQTVAAVALNCAWRMITGSGRP